MSSALKTQIQDAMKAAMKAGDKPRLAVVRLMLAAIKQVEVDERIELDDTRVTTILDKMVKQRRESIAQYAPAGRDDLVAQEQSEIDIIQTFLPQALSTDEIEAIINDAISSTGASSIKDMGKVMGIIRPQLVGRADMGDVSSIIKSRLNAG
ncbi:MAG: GatB/YqeY domain-containing protein [Gammaproteobacteria bacterium]